jgi:hypothetical protein
MFRAAIPRCANLQARGSAVLVYVNVFSALGLDKNVWLVSRPCRFNPNEEAHITHRILGMWCRQADMNIIVDNNILPVPKIEQWLISYIVHRPVTIPAELFREFKIIPFS